MSRSSAITRMDLGRIMKIPEVEILKMRRVMTVIIGEIVWETPR